MKAHIGVTDESGLLHHVECTAANVAGVIRCTSCCTESKTRCAATRGCTGADKREKSCRTLTPRLQGCREAFEGVGDEERTRAPLRGGWEHHKASVRAKVEHPFRVFKREFGYGKIHTLPWPDDERGTGADAAVESADGAPTFVADLGALRPQGGKFGRKRQKSRGSRLFRCREAENFSAKANCSGLLNVSCAYDAGPEGSVRREVRAWEDADPGDCGRCPKSPRSSPLAIRRTGL